MDLENKFVLISPYFQNSYDNKTLALLCDKKNINSSMKYFWNEMRMKSFHENDNDEISNFPMTILDKYTLKQRNFLINQTRTEDRKYKLIYIEIPDDDDSNEICAYDDYANAITNDYNISIRLNKPYLLNTFKQGSLFPRMKRQLYLNFN